MKAVLSFTLLTFSLAATVSADLHLVWRRIAYKDLADCDSPLDIEDNGDCVPQLEFVQEEQFGAIASNQFSCDAADDESWFRLTQSNSVMDDDGNIEWNGARFRGVCGAEALRSWVSDEGHLELWDDGDVVDNPTHYGDCYQNDGSYDCDGSCSAPYCSNLVLHDSWACYTYLCS